MAARTKPTPKKAKTVRDLPLKADKIASVSGGKGAKASILMKSCATGEHIKTATLTC